MAFSDDLKLITPAISEIKTGTPGIKIGDKYIVGGIGGNFIPGGGGGSSSSMKFYKCASIDTTNHAWTGYLASVDPVTGIWSFAETATSGLAYDRITPVVGGVYDENCTFGVKNYKTSIPTDGLVFYLAMDSEIGSKDDTGVHTLNKVSENYSFTTKNGIPCLTGGSGAEVIGPDFRTIIPNTSEGRFTMSIWCARSTSGDSGACFGFANTASGNRPSTGMEVYQGNIMIRYNDAYPSRPGGLDNNDMAFYHITYDGTYIKYYKNLTNIHSITTSYPYGSGFSSWSAYPQPFHIMADSCYYAAFRIYNRLLDSAEIASLANEFTPTVS